MRLADALTAAFENLLAHKLRSALTMLGMMFGVGAVISMLAIGAGAEQDALAMIEKMGVRNVVVRSRDFDPEELKELRKKSIGVSGRDLRAVTEAVPGVEVAVPRLELDAYKILSASGKSEAKVFGVSHLHVELMNETLGEGRFFDARDEREHAGGGSHCD